MMGFATIFPGWNVWDVSQANELATELLMVGLDADRRLRIWVEERANAAPGVAVADPVNPLALKGDQVEILPNAGNLDAAETLESNVLGGNILQIVPARVRAVRFYNRGAQGVIPWPSSVPESQNYLLRVVYQPTPTDPLTSGPAPTTLAGAASSVGKAATKTLQVVLVVGGLALLMAMLAKGRAR